MKASKLVKETKKVVKKEEKAKKSRVAAPKTPKVEKKVEKKESASKKPVNAKVNNVVTTGIVKDKRATKWMTEKDIAFLDKYIKKSA